MSDVLRSLFKYDQSADRQHTAQNTPDSQVALYRNFEEILESSIESPCVLCCVHRSSTDHLTELTLVAQILSCS